MSGWPQVSLRREALVLVGCIALCFLPGAFGSAFPPDAWYEGLAKSALTPPGWVFPIAWSTLYITIGISLYLFLLRARARVRRGPLAVFAVQLVLNGAWSWIFFGRHDASGALVEILVLWSAIVVTIIAFARHSTTAAKLLVPYLAWVTFATYLNLAIVRMNG